MNRDRVDYRKSKNRNKVVELVMCNKFVCSDDNQRYKDKTTTILVFSVSSKLYIAKYSFILDYLSVWAHSFLDRPQYIVPNLHCLIIGNVNRCNEVSPTTTFSLVLEMVLRPVLRPIFFVANTNLNLNLRICLTAKTL